MQPCVNGIGGAKVAYGGWNILKAHELTSVSHVCAFKMLRVRKFVHRK